MWTYHRFFLCRHDSVDHCQSPFQWSQQRIYFFHSCQTLSFHSVTDMAEIAPDQFLLASLDHLGLTPFPPVTANFPLWPFGVGLQEGLNNWPLQRYLICPHHQHFPKPLLDLYASSFAQVYHSFHRVLESWFKARKTARFFQMLVVNFVTIVCIVPMGFFFIAIFVISFNYFWGSSGNELLVWLSGIHDVHSFIHSTIYIAVHLSPQWL